MQNKVLLWIYPTFYFLNMTRIKTMHIAQNDVEICKEDVECVAKKNENEVGTLR